MLNKQICIRCINKHKDRWEWNDYDESKWNNGYVLCPIKWTTIDINDSPHIDCHYKLEHIVSDKEDQ